VSTDMSLAERMDAEFAAASKAVLKRQQQRLREHQERQQRLKELDKKLDELRNVWRPRLETLAQRFESQVKVTPNIQVGNRRATFEFISELASVELRFSVLADEDARELVFQYDLQIIPAFMKYDSHSELCVPVDNIDREAIGRWFDARILSFVQTYLQLYQNERYLKDHLVEDPIAKVRFPKFAAGTTAYLNGKTSYFIGEETRHQFELQQAAK